MPSRRNAHAVAARQRKAGAHGPKGKPAPVGDDYYQEYLEHKAEEEEERQKLLDEYFASGGKITRLEMVDE